MKKHLDVDEWYPVFLLSDDKYFKVEPQEFTEAEIENYNRVLREFRDLQTAIQKRFNAPGV